MTFSLPFPLPSCLLKLLNILWIRNRYSLKARSRLRVASRKRAVPRSRALLFPAAHAWLLTVFPKWKASSQALTVSRRSTESRPNQRVQNTGHFSIGQSTGHHDGDKWTALEPSPSPNLLTKCSIGQSMFGNLSVEQWPALLACGMWPVL